MANNLSKQNICVFIENEAQLQEAKELLADNNQKIESDYFFLSKDPDFADNFLSFAEHSKVWHISYQSQQATITLPALEVILKNQGDIESCEFCNTVCTTDEMRQDEEGCWFCDKCLESII